MLFDESGHLVDDLGAIALIVGADQIDALHDLLHLVGHKAAGGDHGGADAHAAGDAGLLGVVGDGVLMGLELRR